MRASTSTGTKNNIPPVPQTPKKPSKHSRSRSGSSSSAQHPKAQDHGHLKASTSPEKKRPRESKRRKMARNPWLAEADPKAYGYSGFPEFEHSHFRGEVRRFNRRIFNEDPQDPPVQPPKKRFRGHPKPCPFSSDEHSSSGEESDTYVKNNWPTQAKDPKMRRQAGIVEPLFPPISNNPIAPNIGGQSSGILLQALMKPNTPNLPSPLLQTPQQLPQELPSISLDILEQILAPPPPPPTSPMSVQQGVVQPQVPEELPIQELSYDSYFEEGQRFEFPETIQEQPSSSKSSGDVIMDQAIFEMIDFEAEEVWNAEHQNIFKMTDASCQTNSEVAPRPAGLPDFIELTAAKTKKKMIYVAQSFCRSAAIFPTFPLAWNKFISARMPPMAAKDSLDIFGHKRFYFHTNGVDQMRDPQSLVIPLPVDAVRKLMLVGPQLVAHGSSKARCVPAVNEAGKSIMKNPLPIPPVILQKNMTCEFTQRKGFLVLRFINAETDGTPMCKFIFYHLTPAQQKDTKPKVWPSIYLSFMIETVEHLQSNILPLMSEFQDMIFKKGEQLCTRWNTTMPTKAFNRREQVNDGNQPEVTWERGVETAQAVYK